MVSFFWNLCIGLYGVCAEHFLTGGDFSVREFTGTRYTLMQENP